MVLDVLSGSFETVPRAGRRGGMEGDVEALERTFSALRVKQRKRKVEFGSKEQ